MVEEKKTQQPDLAILHNASIHVFTHIDPVNKVGLCIHLEESEFDALAQRFNAEIRQDKVDSGPFKAFNIDPKKVYDISIYTGVEK